MSDMLKADIVSFNKSKAVDRLTIEHKYNII